MILLPVKNLANAKQRLASLLDQSSRTHLAQTMLRDVLETLSAWSNRPEVALVSSDAFAVELAQALHFRVIEDHENRGETHAIERATQVCTTQGARWTLVLPGDIPLLEISELEEVFEAAPPTGSVLVPAADGRGTNAAYRCPAQLFPLRFGNDSFKPHHAAACATGHPCVVLPLPGIGLDIDNPSDLKELALRAGNRHSQLLARQWDLDEFPRAVNE
jgi:2-phospho-L-lactate guanylyltransferase